MTAAPRLWPGQTVAICASGPSLNAEVCESVRGRMPVIAVNDAIQLAPWADVLYSSDRSWYPKRNGVPEFSGPKYSIGSGLGKRNPFGQYEFIRVLRNTGFEGLESEPTGLRNGRHSGYAAVNLAVHFGASRILLFGYDLRKHGHGSRSHFAGCRKPVYETPDGAYLAYARVYQSMVEPLRTMGIEVLNCTPDSAIECFPFISPAEVAA